MEETPTARPISPSLPWASNRSVSITLYVVIAFLYWASMYLYMSTLPNYIQGKVQDLAVVGTVLSMYGLWQAIVRLPVGIGADWLNWHKPFVIAGLCMTGLGAWIMGGASAANALLVGRALTGLGAGVWAVLVVTFSNLFPPDKAVRASAALTLVSSLARMVATSATGVLNQAGGYGLAFLLAAAISGLGILLMLAVREPPRPPQRPSLQGIGSLISRRPVWLPAALNALSQYAIWAVPFGFVPILAKQLGATDTTQSLLLSLDLGMMVLGNLLVTALAGRVRSRRLVIISFVLLCAGVGAAALATALPAIFIGLILIGLSQGIAYPVLMGLSIEKVQIDERATAMGLHQAVYALGMFGGPWLSGILASAIGLQPMFGITAGACLVIGLFGSRWLD
jgi:MFS family permease